MILQLFWKECKQIAISLTYYIFLACLVLFYFSQMSEFEVLDRPLPGEESYGFKYSDDETIVMEKTLIKLVSNYIENKYIAYPVGFYKQVILDAKKQEKMKAILEEATGISDKEMNVIYNYYLTSSPDTENESVKRKEKLEILQNKALTFERFLVLMKQADGLIGGGSEYNEKTINKNATVPRTYEEAVQEYEDILHKDHVSNAYARLFSDYLGILLGILPVFLAVTRALRDKRSQVKEIIFASRTSSISIILSRYLATIAMILLPVILLSVTPTLECLYYANSLNIQADVLAFLNHIFGWLLPTIMVSVSVGFFFTELTDSAVGIMVQGIWWLISIFMSTSNLVGNVGWNLVPRFNVLGDHRTFLNVYTELIRNRIFYAGISILLLIACIVVYDQKRKGVLNLHGKIFGNRKSQSEA